MFRALCRSSSGASTVFAASGLHTLVETARGAVCVPTQTAPQAVSTSVCKPEAANTVEAPDDERHITRNMLSF
jgi:hypothetical protein